MRPNLVNRAALVCLVALMLASPLVAGCVQVQVTDVDRATSTPTVYGELTPPREVRDLAILGIEFNPPLKYEEVLAAGRLTLLVAVENRGLVVENNVLVEARLADVTDSDVLARRSERLDTLAPGEVRLVRFDSLALIPYRSAYLMTVSVTPAPGETHTLDNQRSYRLAVSVATPTPSSFP
jgi:hypothetical protein